MTKFLLLYIGGTMPETKDEQEAVMAEWGAWYTRLGADVVDGGNPFSLSKHVTDAGVADGPVGSHPATGYTIITAASLDDAVAKVDGHPHLKDGGEISIYETFEM